jgi:DNA invertase Pin-like site-specific DNA recombinase
MSPAMLEYMMDVKNRLLAEPAHKHGAIIAGASSFLGCHIQTVYRRLAAVGWNSGRKIRADIRVSSDKQTVENQRFEIRNFCERENLAVDGWIEETISGVKAYNKRELGKLLKKVAGGDLIICAELSRLGRNLFMIMEILNICMTKECKVWTIKDNYRLGDDIQSKVLAFAFGLSAEIERNLISQRTREALARKRAEGVILGRPKGRKSGKVKLSGHEETIQTLRTQGVPKTEIARIFKVNRMTVDAFIRGRMAAPA